MFWICYIIGGVMIVGKEEVLKAIVTSYLDSPDFNGLPLVELGDFNTQDISNLISDKLVEAVSFEDCLNPYIRAYDFRVNLKTQIANVKEKREGTVLYPSKQALLGASTNPAEPYLEELIKGEPQNKIIFFKPEFIMIYLNDPRNESGFYGYRGFIAVEDEYVPKNTNGGKVIINFGIAYKKGKKPERAIGALLIELSKLSSNKQMLWKNFEISKQTNYVINSCFANEVYTGIWSKNIWIFDALLLEMDTINKLCDEMGIPPMFKETYSAYNRNRPIGYTTVLFPSKKNYNDFLMSLEKLLVNNLNAETFLASGEHIRPAYKYDSESREKGTLTLLSEWITSNTSPKENIPELIMNPLKNIRKIRQKPAHRLDIDDYNLDYITKQVDIIKAAYTAIGAIRFRLSKHPNCQEVVVPKSILDVDHIITY